MATVFHVVARVFLHGCHVMPGGCWLFQMDARVSHVGGRLLLGGCSRILVLQFVAPEGVAR